MALLAAPVTNLAAQDSNASTPATTPNAAASPAAPVQLSYTAAEVLKLTRAKVGDDATIAFIQNSRSGYGLDASAIIYLKNEGMSDRVITAMLNEEQNVKAAAAPPASYVAANNAPEYAQPSTAYVQPAPASTSYVIPDAAAYPDYYPYYPYYAYDPWYYWWYSYPAVSFSLGYGNGYYPRTGYYGGGYRGVPPRSTGYRSGLPGNRPPVSARPGGGFRGGGPPRIGSPGGGFRGGGAPSVRPSGGGFRGGGSPSVRFSGGTRGGGSNGLRH